MVIQKPPQKRAAGNGTDKKGVLARVVLAVIIVAALGFVVWRVAGGGSSWSEERARRVEQMAPALPASPSTGLPSGPTMGPGGAFAQFREQMLKKQPRAGQGQRP